MFMLHARNWLKWANWRSLHWRIFLSGSFFDLEGKEPDSNINHNEIMCKLTDLQWKRWKTEKSDRVFESSCLVENLTASQVRHQRVFLSPCNHEKPAQFRANCSNKKQNCCFFSTPWKHFWCLSWEIWICLQWMGEMSTKIFYRKPRECCSPVTNHVISAAQRKESLGYVTWFKIDQRCLRVPIIAAIIWATYIKQIIEQNYIFESTWRQRIVNKYCREDAHGAAAYAPTIREACCTWVSARLFWCTGCVLTGPHNSHWCPQFN